MKNVRSSAIFIDKDMTSLNVITTIMRNDHFCWKDKRIGGEQIACTILLCHFHTIKTWSEHLLLRVPFNRRDELWQLFMTILRCPV